MALKGENELKFEVWVLQKLKDGMTVNAVAKLFEGEDFETLKREQHDKIPLFLWFVTKYNDVDSRLAYKKRVKKIDNMHSKFRKLNATMKFDVSRMEKGLTVKENLNHTKGGDENPNHAKINPNHAKGGDENPNHAKINRDYLEGLDYEDIKFSTKFGRLTMEELKNNIEMKVSARDIFHKLFVDMETDVASTVRNFQSRINSLLEMKEEGKEVLFFIRSFSIYIKTFKNFVPIPNLGTEVEGVKDLLVMEAGGSREGVIKKTILDLNQNELNDEELALILADNTPSI